MPDKQTVTYEDIEEFLTHTREEDEFSLFSYIAKAKLESALECLHTLLRTKDSAGVASMCASRLSTYFRRALSVQINVSNGCGIGLRRDEDSTAFSKKVFDSDRPITMPKDREIYRDCCNNYSQRDMERILVTLAEYDIRIKETPVGAGIGFVMKGGANTGGTDIVAQILNKYTPLSLGTCLTLVDAIIIAASVFVFGIESALFAVTTVYITGITIDKVALPLGANTAKTVLIISEKHEEISQVILNELNHGATLLSATGLYTGNDRPVIMSVVSNQEVTILTARVKEIDDKAFMIVQNANQVLGEGFIPISKAINLKFGN